jgi:hypothetical protein
MERLWKHDTLTIIEQRVALYGARLAFQIVGSCRLDVAEAFGSAAKVVPGEIIFITDRQDSYREIGPLVRL